MNIPLILSRWNWSWGFGLFIALPALALALLGLRAVRAERIEREQQLREQQVQIARLIEAAISTRINSLPTELKHRTQNATPDETLTGIYGFSLDQNKTLTFPDQRIYFGEQTSTAWPLNVENLLEQAQAAKAQGRSAEASTLYRRIIDVEPKLTAWAELNNASIKYDEGGPSAFKALAYGKLADSGATTPTGLPVALIACGHIERMPAKDQSKFSSFVEQTLESLRRGRWWLSYEERSFYDGQLRQLLEHMGTKPSEDRELRQLAAVEQIVRRASLPLGIIAASCSFERVRGEGFLISIAKESGSASQNGFALPRDRSAGLFDSVVSPLLSGQLFGVEVRDADGGSVWGKLHGAVGHTEPLRAVHGLELAFSGLNGPRWLDQKQLLWLGFIVLLVVMMIAGLAMTARVVRREVELVRIQNEFIAAVSHEFKSPIASVRLLMERITTGRVRDSETISEYYAAIDRESERLERLVNRLLEWQQIQAGCRRYSFAPTSATELVRTAIEEMRPQAEAKGIGFEVSFDDSIAEVAIDGAAMTDAVENLIDNAIKYSPASTKITVSCQTIDHHPCIEVRDQGIGIPHDELPRIFDRFYRGQRGDLSNVHGTGLGLALVKATVEGHGGEVEVSSEPGLGSCFRICLPIQNGVPIDGANSNS